VLQRFVLECCKLPQTLSNKVLRSLDDLPGGQRTKIGFITFELFVPLPDNLLVNLVESRSVVESFLDSLPEMFAKNPVISHSCLGPALKEAFTVMKQVGGKMYVFQSIQPNLGDGSIFYVDGCGSETPSSRHDMVQGYCN
jgi:protein transport protein SEC24